MRRRQVWTAQRERLEAETQSIPVDTEELKVHLKAHRTGICPKCGKHIGRGMYFHVRSCGGAG